MILGARWDSNSGPLDWYYVKECETIVYLQ